MSDAASFVGFRNLGTLFDPVFQNLSPPLDGFPEALPAVAADVIGDVHAS